MGKREFVMLAHSYVDGKHLLGGNYLSTKLDGIRAFWDGGITRSMRCVDVPWANTAKDSRYVVPPDATGLWSRYGHPIQAPNYWLNALPKMPLDGELLYYGDPKKDTWEETSRIVQAKVNLIPEKWGNIDFWAFDSPPPESIFQSGSINNTNFKRNISTLAADWAIKLMKLNQCRWLKRGTPFYVVQNTLKLLTGQPYFKILPQVQLPNIMSQAREIFDKTLAEAVESGKEGLMLRSAISIWIPERSHDLLKVKPFKDAEAKVIGYYWGEPTDVSRSTAGLEGVSSGLEKDKMVGAMGSLLLMLENGKTFKLATGFKMDERAMTFMTDNGGARLIALENGKQHPGEICAIGNFNPMFKIGEVVTFKYRALTSEGLPKEARYFRKHQEI